MVDVNDYHLGCFVRSIWAMARLGESLVLWTLLKTF